MAQPVWQTNSNLGVWPALTSNTISLLATPVSPANSISYLFLSGSLPNGLNFDNVTGNVTGTADLVDEDTISNFGIRAIDNLNNFRDRTFTITVTGNAIPTFTTPSGNILYTEDSVWINQAISYSNPDPNNPVSIELFSGSLPPGTYVTTDGIIRGYANPPTLGTNFSSLTTSVLSSNSSTNTFTATTTSGFSLNRPVQFEGANIFGNVLANTTYYINEIQDISTFSISESINGSDLGLTTVTGNTMTANLIAANASDPVIQTYDFTLRLNSPLGEDLRDFSITVENWNLNNPQNTRIPTILNSRPLTLEISPTNQYEGYYILPPVSPSSNAYIGNIQSGTNFNFKVIGHDFDGDGLTYEFANLPSGLTGDAITGWVSGNISANVNTIQEYSFSANVFKTSNPAIYSGPFNFSLVVENNVTSRIDWLTESDLGTIFNGGISYFNVKAQADVEIVYEVIAGNLPPNLNLESNGEIPGRVSFEPSSSLIPLNTETDFSFTVKAYSPDFPVVTTTKEFTISVFQEFDKPTDILYIKAAPSVADRELIDSLLNDEALIPNDLIYRPDDIYFGKASSVVYEHAFGIYASDIERYLDAVSKNHYWRNITLGELKTAVARDSQGNVLYEVVYSQVIDNLINPKGQSISNEIIWPRLIPLYLGPWYTSLTNVYTSFIFGEDTLMGDKKYFTALSPGFVRDLYPNSLVNMRERIATAPDPLDPEKPLIGQEYNSNLLPLWMTSQQANGSTLGYTTAWVICYLKPTQTTNPNPNGRTNAEQVKYNIENNWKDEAGNPFKLNLINFRLDRFSVDKSATYNYDTIIDPPAWISLPGAVPTPDPIDSEDFYVLFPRKTILPTETQI